LLVLWPSFKPREASTTLRISVAIDSGLHSVDLFYHSFQHLGIVSLSLEPSSSRIIHYFGRNQRYSRDLATDLSLVLSMY